MALPPTRSRYALILAGLLVLAISGLAQRRFRGERFPEHEEEGPRPSFPTGAEFHFIRVEYTDLPQYHRFFGFASRNGQGDGWWIVDWPDADDHFSLGIQRLTRVATGDPRHLRLTDEHLFDYPWIYATQTGWWGLIRRRNRPPARISAARRILGHRRFLGRRLGNVPRDHAARAAE